LAVITIRVVSRADTFMAEGNMLKGMSMSEVRARHEPKLCGITISAKGAKVGKVVRGIRWRTHQGTKGEGFGFKVAKDIKRVSRDDFRKARDYSNAVLSIRSLEEGSIIGRGGRRKSRGRFRM
jgi:hypothetical protein